MVTTESSTLNQNIEDIKKTGLPIVIYGAGIVGEALYAACQAAGIRPACFCDNNAHKTQAPKCGIEVIHTPNLKKKYPDALFLISAADIRDVLSQLNEMGYSRWLPSALLLRDFDLSKHKFSAPEEFVEYAVATCLLCQDSYLNKDKLFLRSVDIIITERCSLRCRDCSNLMQYYKKPVDCDTNELLRCLGEFCNIIDEANEFRIIGGEPFMNKEFHFVIERLTLEPKVKKIVIYTNGTILPSKSQIEYLKNEKVLLIITDYGSLSKKLSALIEALKQEHIAYYTQKAEGWADCAKITKHNRSAQQLKEIFRNCCAKNTTTLSNAKLYRCPFSANLDRLMAVPSEEIDSINIFQKTQKSAGIDMRKEKIKDFLMKKESLRVCDYCNGRPFTAPEITPAFQAAKPLEYGIQQK